ncbi:ABC transporter substrate-binding protein, partial [Acinetobacter baumannii]
GLFRAEGLTVTADSATSSLDAIARVASGSSDMALADINALIRYRDKEGSLPIKAVFVLYNKAPYAIIARKSRGIATLP